MSDDADNLHHIERPEDCDRPCALPPEASNPVMSERDICKSLCWMDEYGRDAECSLDEGHEGLHVDMHEGWEW